MGGDVIYGEHSTQKKVSIHTPVWGVTRAANETNIKLARVSIHTPVWGVTDSGIQDRHHYLCFNPHPRMGGDVLGKRLLESMSSFNPHPRMGGDSNIPKVKWL